MAAQQAAEATTTLSPPSGIWDVDTRHSSLEFVARHILTKVRGRFEDFSGTITIADDPHQSSAQATIRTASVKTFDDQRDGHLRSPDFFGVDEWPEISFRSTAIGTVGDNRYRVTGDLTVRDVTRSIDLDAEFVGWSVDHYGNDRATFTASTRVKREDFGLTWNLALEAGGWLVGKDVDLELEIAAVRRAES
ncbi:MAG TPA: YceI family protein [Actinomycetota bacterium]|jgi:polyisoprenoid-binding protein YceI|nr:YceI family protein [Actinomycetota bacterium]